MWPANCNLARCHGQNTHAVADKEENVMKRLSLITMVLVVGYAMIHMGCMDREPAPVCPVPTELNETDVMLGGFEGVDMLVVVDNSISMAEEQEILATAFFPLVNSLVNPLPGWSWPSVDDVRIAIVTSDMGLSWGGNPYEEGDGWPGTNPCSASGDNGVFQTYASGINHRHRARRDPVRRFQCPVPHRLDLQRNRFEMRSAPARPPAETAPTRFVRT